MSTSPPKYLGTNASVSRESKRHIASDLGSPAQINKVGRLLDDCGQNSEHQQRSARQKRVRDVLGPQSLLFIHHAGLLMAAYEQT